MKYIQDESTNTLIFYIFFWIAVAFLIVKWDLYEKRKSEERNEYRDSLSKFRLRAIFIIILIGLFATVKELLNRI
jgi:uncharacterized membrane protein